MSNNKARDTRSRPVRHIYVIKLSKGILKKRRFAQRNPNYDGKSACVYVGLTARTPEERFEQHMAGVKSSRFVKEFGKRLLPHLGKRTRKSHAKALKLEQELPERLREKGFGVWQA